MRAASCTLRARLASGVRARARGPRVCAARRSERFVKMEIHVTVAGDLFCDKRADQVSLVVAAAIAHDFGVRRENAADELSIAAKGQLRVRIIGRNQRGIDLQSPCPASIRTGNLVDRLVVRSGRCCRPCRFSRIRPPPERRHCLPVPSRRPSAECCCCRRSRRSSRR